MKESNKQTENKPSKLLFVFIIVLYAVTSFLVIVSSRSDDTAMIFGMQVPIVSFVGMLSYIANICLIFLTVLYGHLGFIVSLSISCFQIPMVCISFFVMRSAASLPGFFSNVFTAVTIILIYRRNLKIAKYQEREIDFLKEEQRLSQQMFKQTATALVNAIDAKDTYSHGHSLRVAEYSEKIAKQMGKSEEECNRIYYAALLHDVGKIGVSDSIITKKGKLTDEEFEAIKQHPDMGNQILAGISDYPYLSVGAHYHHERYDGSGYPNRLKGEEIPEIARIISVADAYDAMTSNRSYRDAIPQQIVREEIVKGAGSQFDPVAARIMQSLIDIDTDYKMKERYSAKEFFIDKVQICGEYRDRVSDGILVTRCMKKMRLKYTPDKRTEGESSVPTILLFDALDGMYHSDERSIGEMLYFEYCEIPFYGEVNVGGARRVQTEIRGAYGKNGGNGKEMFYDIEAVKYKDHVLIRIGDGAGVKEVTVALPDSTRYAFIGLTGEHCRLSNMNIVNEDTQIGEDYITRIAEEISYIDGIVGDVPNVQIDGFRTDATGGVPVTDGLKLSFHSMSLPTSRLVWHCPYIVLFYSADKKVNGENYREYALIRFDGEGWEDEARAENELLVTRKDDFEGWEAWKHLNKEGINCFVSFERKGDRITVNTENLGLAIKNTTTIKDGTREIYAAITGDQCAITDIRISG